MAVRFRLRELLEDEGVGQSEASRRSGVSFAMINRMCTNATRRVDLDVIDSLCVEFGFKPGELFEFPTGKKAKRG